MENQQSSQTTSEDASKEVLAIFQRTNALLEGHFLLTSGLHSTRYLQCALVLQHPSHAEKLGKQLAKPFKKSCISAVVAPAIGGIVVAHETARALGVRALFTERENGVMTFRRGFSLHPGERILVVEDVVTTGGSTRETIEAVEQAGGVVIGAGSIVDRSGGSADVGVRRVALMTLSVPSYQPDACPLCSEGNPVVKPGSRQ
jgi:orotate phosphoribosyltransferase